MGYQGADYIVSEDASEWESVLVLWRDSFLRFGGCCWCEFDYRGVWVVASDRRVSVQSGAFSKEFSKE